MSAPTKPGKVVRCQECTGRGFVMAPIVDKRASIWDAKNVACDGCDGYGYITEPPPLPDVEVA